MKIKTGKQTALEVIFFAESYFNRGEWDFTLPTIEVGLEDGELEVCFCAFFWDAGVAVKKVKNENKD